MYVSIEKTGSTNIEIIINNFSDSLFYKLK